MDPRQPLLDFAYFLLLLFLVAYGILLVLRGYAARAFSGARKSRPSGA